MHEERFTGGGELDATAAAGEQRDPEFVFERLDLVTERGLHHEAPLGRAGEVLLLGDGEDVPHLLQFHAVMFSVHHWYDNNLLDS